jgi:hypothetical protein
MGVSSRVRSMYANGKERSYLEGYIILAEAGLSTDDDPADGLRRLTELEARLKNIRAPSGILERIVYKIGYDIGLLESLRELQEQ